MKGRQLLDAMAYIDDALIEENAPLLENEQTDAGGFAARKRRYYWKSITACAAVFAVAAVSLWVWKSGIVPQERTVLDKGQSAGAYDTGGLSGGDIMLENAPADMAAAEPAQNQDAAGDAGVRNEAGVSGAAVSDDAVAEGEAVVGQNKEDGVEDLYAGQSKGSVVRVIEEYSLPAVYCYAAPEKGSSIICAELKAAIDYYDYAHNTLDIAEPESYLYHVKIDVFGETDNDTGKSSEQENWQELRFSEEGKEKLYQEYERMLSTGLDVSLSEEYELTGMFSHEEIENFVPAPEYGYAFRLINEN